MNPYNRQQIGKNAEQQALLYLQKQGLQLLVQNYTCYSGEIDLIMSDNNDIVFIEVRSRSRTDYGHAAESITPHKQRKIIRAATHFLQKKECLYKVCSRFDVIEIQLVANKWKLAWIKNAFLVDT